MLNMVRDGLAAGRGLDLHMHSTFSDGSCSVAELIEMARAAKLAGIAVTDHDSLTQLAQVRAVAREAEFPVLAGIEVSAADARTGRKVHILGLGLEATQDGSGPIERVVAQTLANRAANTLWQAWRIERAARAGDLGALDTDAAAIDSGFSVDAAIDVAGASTAVYKQHVMEALCRLPYTDAGYQKLYRSVFKGDGIAVRDISYPEAACAVRAICEQGGVAVLAHPGQMNSWSIIPDLVAAGLRGIEAYHPDHAPADERRACEAAAAHGLFVTGGSDYHGRFGAPEAVGCVRLPAREVQDACLALFEREAQLA